MPTTIPPELLALINDHQFADARRLMQATTGLSQEQSALANELMDKYQDHLLRDAETLAKNDLPAAHAHLMRIAFEGKYTRTSQNMLRQIRAQQKRRLEAAYTNLSKFSEQGIKAATEIHNRNKFGGEAQANLKAMTILIGAFIDPEATVKTLIAALTIATKQLKPNAETFFKNDKCKTIKATIVTKIDEAHARHLQALMAEHNFEAAQQHIETYELAMPLNKHDFLRDIGNKQAELIAEAQKLLTTEEYLEIATLLAACNFTENFESKGDELFAQAESFLELIEAGIKDHIENLKFSEAQQLLDTVDLAPDTHQQLQHELCTAAEAQVLTLIEEKNYAAAMTLIESTAFSDDEKARLIGECEAAQLTPATDGIGDNWVMVDNDEGNRSEEAFSLHQRQSGREAALFQPAPAAQPTTTNTTPNNGPN